MSAALSHLPRKPWSALISRACPMTARPTWPMRRRRQSSSGFGPLSPAAAKRIPNAVWGRSAIANQALVTLIVECVIMRRSALLNQQTEFLLCWGLRPRLQTGSRVARFGPTTPTRFRVSGSSCILTLVLGPLQRSSANRAPSNRQHLSRRFLRGRKHKPHYHTRKLSSRSVRQAFLRTLKQMMGLSG